ncbi:MAG: hypothetical protein OQL16_10365 [Gammaproteobacteria bacterium]|nr:hypothetical protein [Gammaproteobacteria bacterium]
MEPVVQEEITGCGIASAAAIAGITYNEAKATANSLGIHAEDESLWSSSKHVRKLLAHLGVQADENEKPFQNWASLPDCALLSTKWHIDKGKPYWHWAVFVRKDGQSYVLDPKKALKSNMRTDFGRMRPKWFIEVHA